ncbi:MAG: hypothetical protein WCX12_03775 [Candidatus Paceibacterota bacterium]|jgi:hypothetical protein
METTNSFNDPIGAAVEPANPVPPSHSHLSKKLIIAFIAAGVVIVGGAAFGFTYFQNEDPSQVVNKAVANLSKIKSEEFSIEIKSEISDGSSKTDSLPLSLLSNNKIVVIFSALGGFDINDQANPKVFANLKFDAKQGIKYSANVDLDGKFIDKILYLKPNNLNLADFFGGSAATNPLDQFKDNWIKIDFNSAKENISTEEENYLKSYFEKYLSSSKFNQFADSLQNYHLLIVTKNFPKEKMEGNNVNHFAYSINKDEAKKWYLDMMNIMSGQTVGASQSQYLTKAVDKTFDSIGNIDGEIWIGDKDYFIYKISSGYQSNSTSSYTPSYNFSSTISYKNHNKPINADVPAQFTDIKEVITALMGDQLVQSKDTTVFSDLSTLNSAIALYLSDVANPYLCKDKNTIYATSKITVPPGWKLGSNAGRDNVDGTGWIPVNFTSISTGAPIAHLPLPPTDKNSTSTDKEVYIFVCDPQIHTYELNAKIKSEKFASSSEKDGGDDPYSYEVGIAPGLKLIPGSILDKIKIIP